MKIALVLCVFAIEFSSSLPLNKSEEVVGDFDEVYDQRQNGTENYRVNMGGVVLLWTPPSRLLSALNLIDVGTVSNEVWGDEETPGYEEDTPTLLELDKYDETTLKPTEVSSKKTTKAGKLKRFRKHNRVPSIFKLFMKDRRNFN